MVLQLSDKLVCSERALKMIGGNTLLNAGMIKYILNSMLYAPHA